MFEFKLNGYAYQMVPRPDETLRDEKRDRVIADAIPVARNAFDNDGVTESDIITHAMETDATIFVRDAKDNLVGFSSVNLIQSGKVQSVYLEGTAIAKEHQGNKIYSVVNPLRIVYGMNRLGVESGFVSTRTQNPRVYESMRDYYNMWPHAGKSIPPHIMEAAQQVAEVVYQKHSDFRHPNGLLFDGTNLVQRMAYGKLEGGTPVGFCMYSADKFPWSRKQEINEFMRSIMDFSNGDAIIVTGEVDRRQAMLQLEVSSYI